MDEKINGDKIIYLEEKIEPGKVHQLHIHENEYVIRYSIEGRYKVTIGEITQIILSKTMIFLPPKVPHRFRNHTKKKLIRITFSIESKLKIKNIWMDKKNKDLNFILLWRIYLLLHPN